METMTRIWISRSQSRISGTGEVAFDITYNVGSDEESWSRVPITALMDLADLTFEYHEVANAVNSWIDVAKDHPFVRRNCICCRRRATKGTILCTRCTPIYGPTVYADDECVTDEPGYILYDGAIRQDVIDGSDITDNMDKEEKDRIMHMIDQDIKESWEGMPSNEKDQWERLGKLQLEEAAKHLLWLQSNDHLLESNSNK